MNLRPFQRRFLRSALKPGIDVAALSIPRGNGKFWLATYLLTRCLTPTDHLFVQGAEYLLCAASIEQARLCYRFIRADLEPSGQYRFIDSVTRLGDRPQINQHSPPSPILKRQNRHGDSELPLAGG